MSQFKTFLLPVEPDAAAEEELNAFLRGHRVVDVQRLCVPERGWCFCVEWLEGPAGGTRPTGFSGRIDYMKELPPDTFAIFSKLRTVRKELAKETGVPPFGVATDAQLGQELRVFEPEQELAFQPEQQPRLPPLCLRQHCPGRSRVSPRRGPVPAARWDERPMMPPPRAGK